ncbi:MAG: tRNA pseudouridine(55) synthase TruB [Myxococcales bacterium]|nr:tRNA pseudouridine(55) synthase TruB [Myxococcales bacterium]
MNGVLVVDKPAGLTSHDVVSQARRALGTKKVGHAGTLDPMATGVLVLTVGEGGKLSPYLTADEKVYEAEITLGSSTDTLDAEGECVARAPLPSGLDLASLRALAQGMVGELRQRAPAVSAIKVGGVALYRRVRRGEAVEAPIRDVSLYAIEVHAYEEPRIRLSLRCSKGFYVRSLARDLAEALGTVGHLSALRRVRSGRFEIGLALPFESLRPEQRDSLREALLPVDRIAGSVLAPVLLNAQGSEDARSGRPVRAEGCVEGRLPESSVSTAPGPDAATHVLFEEAAEGRRLLALARVQEDHLRVVRGFSDALRQGTIARE